MRLFLWVFVLFFGCCPGGHIASVPHADVLDLTVALVTSADKAYCAGTWVAPDQILTAAHCVIDDDSGEVATSANVRDYEGSKFPADVKRVDKRSDLALLVVPGMRHPFAPVAKTWSKGEELTIIGHPGRVEFAWLRGWVSAFVRHDSPNEDPGNMSMLQVQAPVWYGNSGGGAFDSMGALVGVCSMRSSVVPELALFVAPDEIAALLAQ